MGIGQGGLGKGRWAEEQDARLDPLPSQPWAWAATQAGLLDGARLASGDLTTSAPL